ncbi:MAG: hypothetical protein M3Z09_10800 [Acidobacteriota bacterium]|nr:hypothetical protein [Acidobacteriota bacterium]
MILPSTYYATLALLVLSMLCWGSWANTIKLTGKWRFELFYFDYSLGLMMAAVIAALTFGTLGFDGFSFMDDLLHASKKQDLYGFAAGVIFNLANILLVAAISLAGMAVAFPVSIGLALVIGVGLSYVIKPQGSPVLLFAGAAIVLSAVVVNAIAYKAYKLTQVDDLVRTGKVKSTKRQVSTKGVVIAIISGFLMGSFFPLVELGKAGDTGLGPYAIGFVFALGVFLSTFLFNLFFMNLPVSGPPVEVLEYFRGTLRQHLLGILGGAVWYAGAIFAFVAASAEGKASVGPAVSYGLGQGATLISALWGLLVWKEFAGAQPKVNSMLAVMLALFALGLVMISVAPLVGR